MKLKNQNYKLLLDLNHFQVTYKGKKEKLNVNEQNFKIKDDIKIRIKYDPKKNLSQIITKESGSEKLKEEKPGLTLLKLQINKGKLEYTY